MNIKTGIPIVLIGSVLLALARPVTNGAPLLNAQAPERCHLECDCPGAGCCRLVCSGTTPGSGGGGGGGGSGGGGSTGGGGGGSGGAWGGDGICNFERCITWKAQWDPHGGWGTGWQDGVCRVLPGPDGSPVSDFGAAWVMMYAPCNDPIHPIFFHPLNQCCGAAAPTPTPEYDDNPLHCLEGPESFVPGDGWVEYRIGEDWCGLTMEATAHARPVEVSFNPGPRSLVNMETTFYADTNLEPNDWAMSGAVDDWDPEAWEEQKSKWIKMDTACPGENTEFSPAYKNFRIGVRLQRVTPESNYFPLKERVPCWTAWDWDERDWGSPKTSCADQSIGPVVEHTYLTSSAGKPQNGMGLDGVANLPAYQVGVESYWVAHWRWEWDALECKGHTTCTYRKCKGDDAEGHCTGWEDVVAHPCAQVGWTHHVKQGAIDLSEPPCSNPTWFLKSHLIRTPDDRVGNALPVPIIEVQGVIENPNP